MISIGIPCIVSDHVELNIERSRERHRAFDYWSRAANDSDRIEKRLFMDLSHRKIISNYAKYEIASERVLNAM